MVLSARLPAFAAALLVLGSGALAAPRPPANETMPMRLMDATPNYPHDPNTIAACSWWWDNDGQIPCASMPSEWGISMENFLRWNPSITSSCGNFLLEHSYCVEAPNSPDPTISSSTATAPTTTKPANGIETPEPIQPGMVGNCQNFYFVKKGQSCSAVLSAAQVSLAQLYEWNPAVQSDCSGLWAEVNVCVGIIGQATTTTAKPTTTAPANGITTPTPIQDGMVSNCNKFYFVKEGQTCSSVLSTTGISLAQLFQWNPMVKNDCSGLWSKVNVCIGVIGQATTTAKPTSTAPSNGIATPTPTQDGMVGNCNKFHYISKGTTCQQVLSYNGISLADFANWNPAVGSTCSGLWSETYACVGVIGQATKTTQVPTTTSKPGNGVTTPTPTQPGMVSNCNKFHYISKGNTCQQIVDYQKITMANFLKWNTGFGSNCAGMWAEAHACVGVF